MSNPVSATAFYCAGTRMLDAERADSLLRDTWAAAFMGDDGKTRGRPVGFTVDGRGALIVADDLSNTIWRVTAAKQ